MKWVFPCVYALMADSSSPVSLSKALGRPPPIVTLPHYRSWMTTLRLLSNQWNTSCWRQPPPATLTQKNSPKIFWSCAMLPTSQDDSLRNICLAILLASASLPTQNPSSKNGKPRRRTAIVALPPELPRCRLAMTSTPDPFPSWASVRQYVSQTRRVSVGTRLAWSSVAATTGSTRSVSLADVSGGVTAGSCDQWHPLVLSPYPRGPLRGRGKYFPFYWPPSCPTSFSVVRRKEFR